MSTVTSAQVELTFADDDKRTYTLPSIPSSAASLVGSRIMAINAGTAENVAAFRQTFVSNGGASFVSISAGTVTTIVEEVIYDG